MQTHKHETPKHAPTHKTAVITDTKSESHEHYNFSLSNARCDLKYNAHEHAAVLIPEEDLKPNHTYIAEIDTQIETESGLKSPLKLSWKFYTGKAPANKDSSMPSKLPLYISKVFPSEGQENVSLDTDVRIVFSEAIEPNSLYTQPTQQLV